VLWPVCVYRTLSRLEHTDDHVADMVRHVRVVQRRAQEVDLLPQVLPIYRMLLPNQWAASFYGNTPRIEGYRRKRCAFSSHIVGSLLGVIV
jgi:hypothetical protein